MSELASLYTNTMSILRAVVSADAAGGQEPAYVTLHEDVPCRIEEHGHWVSPPPDVGGAPTIIRVTKIFFDDPGEPEIMTGDYVEAEGVMLRIVDGPERRRQVDDMPEFLVLSCREVTG